MNDDIVIRLDHITKSFPGVKALDDVSIEIPRGTVHALVGENGAGKSTLIKVLAGIYQPDSGSIFLEGREVHFRVPVDALRSGISVIHQELKLSETLSVAENIFLGNWQKKGRLIDWKQIRSKAAQMIHDLNVDLDPDTPVENLSVAKKQIVEICKSISRDAKIIVMDEPSATLTDRELNILFSTIRKLRAKGYTIIYISHRMDEIFDLADNVSVLRDGCLIQTLPIGEITRNGLIEMMVGRELNGEYVRHRSPVSDDVILEVQNLTRQGVFRDVSFKLHKGEVLGISGLVGAGRTEVARAILGIDRYDSGKVLYKGSEVHWDFKGAIRCGLGLVPEDRKLQGLTQMFPVTTNTTMVALKKTLVHGFIDRRLEADYANHYVELLNIMTPSIDTEVQYLSGGNQQKVVFGKWLMQESELLILDEPTRGVDVGAKREIYSLISDMVDSGKTVIMISSEMPELIGICDRIVVMCAGRTVGEFKHGEATQEKILSLCV